MDYNSQFFMENLERANFFDIPEWGFEPRILDKNIQKVFFADFLLYYFELVDGRMNHFEKVLTVITHVKQ